MAGRDSKPLGQKYHCDYCRKDISGDVRVRCAECSEFDLCIECFSVGVEILEHKNNHDYHIIDLLNFPVFNLQWRADEEIALLEGIEMYGLGNWVDIAEHVGTKTAVECERHYWSTYIDVPSYPLPDTSHVFSAEEMEQVANAPRETPKQKQPNFPKTQPSLPVDADLGGYMPKRGDFEVEHWNDAEMLVKDVQFHPHEAEVDTELKLKTLDIYNKKLTERYEMRRFVVSNWLHDAKKRSAMERKRSKQDRELFHRTRALLQLMDMDKYSSFLDGLIAEKECRSRIRELQHYRTLGIRSFSELERYEADRKKRDHDMSARRSKDRETILHPERAQRANSRWLAREKEELGVKKPSRRVGAPLEIATSPGYDLLSEKERSLCSVIRLYPRQYTVIKETLLRENLRAKGLQRRTALQLIKIDPLKTGQIYDFFVSQRWIVPCLSTSTQSSSPSSSPSSSAPVSQVPPTVTSTTSMSTASQPIVGLNGTAYNSTTPQPIVTAPAPQTYASPSAASAASYNYPNTTSTTVSTSAQTTTLSSTTHLSAQDANSTAATGHFSSNNNNNNNNSATAYSSQPSSSSSSMNVMPSNGAAGHSTLANPAASTLQQNPSQLTSTGAASYTSTQQSTVSVTATNSTTTSAMDTSSGT